MHSAGGPGRLRALVIVKISRAVGDACRAASGRRNRRRCREGDKPPIDLNGWWRRPHIPTRGEEALGGLCSLSITARDSQKPPHLSR